MPMQLEAIPGSVRDKLWEVQGAKNHFKATQRVKSGYEGTWSCLKGQIKSAYLTIFL